MSKSIVMCQPTNFDVNYVINPWMEGNLQLVDHFTATKQWNELRNALVSVGADVIVMPEPPKECPDAVFTANAGLVYKNKFITSSFRHKERQCEETFFSNWFDLHDFSVERPYLDKPRIPFEGAGDALFSHDRRNLWVGYGLRTSLKFKTKLDAYFEEDNFMVRPLELVDPRFYHLDTCFCPLDTGEVIWYPSAFSEHSRYIIELWYQGRLIEVDDADAAAFACNAVSIGSNIILPKVSDKLVYNLDQIGYNVIQVDMSQYLRSGGACKCLTLELFK